jgi:RNA polymerase sigma factor (sigma-70 family)
MTLRTARPLPLPQRRSLEEGNGLADIRLPSVAPQTLPELASAHGLDLVRFSYLICGDRSRAEDLVQDVLLAMYRRFGSTLPVADPLAYARRAIINANVSWSRRPARREVPSDQLPEPAISSDPPDDQLWQLLSTLGRRRRSVLVLRYYLGYPDADIAEALGCRRATVRSLAARALAELRDRLRTLDEGTPS